MTPRLEWVGPPASDLHHHKLTYYGEIDNVPGLRGTFMVWHCWCGGRWSIRRRGYERLLRGEISLEA